jgi:UDP-4-amino-4,6-dideoxy-N-acetyl-beta-L-altrosamine N-acetyltransferase
MDVELIEPYSLGNIIFKNYIVLSIEEKKEVLEFRNHPLVRSMMRNKDEIKLTHHLDFIDKLKSEKKNCYWAVIRKNKLVGSVNLKEINSVKKSAFWGVFLNPNYIGTGIGVEIQYEFMKLFFETLKFKIIFAEALKVNRDTLSIQSKFLFELVEESTDYFLMKLESDQWSKLSTTTFKEFKRKIILK